MILGLHHAAMAVPDMEAALRFYGDLLGFEVCGEATLPRGFAPMSEAFGIADAGCKVRMLRKGNSLLELFEFDDALEGEANRPVNRIGITHVAVASDDVVEDYRRLEEAGVVFHAPLFGEAPPRFAYGRDPFGNVVELLEHVPGGDTARRFD